MKLIALALLLLPIAYSYQYIQVAHTGFGKTPNEIILTIHNTGDEELNGLKVFVDGNLYKEIQGLVLTPKNGFELRLYLEPGEHQINVRVGKVEEMLKINVPQSFEQPQKISSPSPINQKAVLIAILAALAIFVAYLLFFKKNKL